MSLFDDAKRDAEDLAKLVNENTAVNTRYGSNPKQSFLAKQTENDAEFQSSQTQRDLAFNLSLDGYQNQIDMDLETLKRYRGFRVAGSFSSGFIYEIPNDVGVDDNGDYWIYSDIDELPFTVPSNTTPTPPTYTKVTFNDHSATVNRDALNSHPSRAITNDDGLSSQQSHEAIKSNLIAQGLSGDFGFFDEGFTYNSANDIGIDSNGESYLYIGGSFPFVVPPGTTPSGPDYKKFNLNNSYQKTGTIDNFGLSTEDLNNSTKLNNMLQSQRYAHFNMNDGDIYEFTEPVQLRSLTTISGSSRGATRQGNNIEFYSGLKKTSNTTVEITNPERPTQTVDCLLYCNGQWEDGNYPQKQAIRDISIRSDSPTPVDTCFYTIQGGNFSISNVDMFDFTYAIKGDEMWSCKIDKLVTNGIVQFTNGTSVELNQCASGGTGNSGMTTGGFIFEFMLYSVLNACSSDAGNRTAYYFNGCQGFVLNGCGSEFVNATNGNDNVGSAFHCLSSNITLNNFIIAANDNGNKPLIGVESNSYIKFSGGSAYFNSSETLNNTDVVISGSDSTVFFENFRFSSGSYSTPKIRIVGAVTNSRVVVTDPLGITREFYPDAGGVIQTKVLNVPERIVGTNGTAIKYGDGTLVCYYDLPRELFFNPGSSIIFPNQGINYYGSAVSSWTYPVAFADSNILHTVTPITRTAGSSGVRGVNYVISDAGQSQTRTGEIQLISVEDYTSGSNGYNNLIKVQIRAEGRWF